MKKTKLFLERSAAVAIDWIVVYMAAHTADFSHGSILAAWLVYEAFSTHWKGFTLGKYCLGLRVTTPARKNPPISKAFLRALGKALSTAALFLGCVWMLWDKKGQTWHDQMTGTAVIRVR